MKTVETGRRETKKECVKLPSRLSRQKALTLSASGKGKGLDYWRESGCWRSRVEHRTTHVVIVQSSIRITLPNLLDSFNLIRTPGVHEYPEDFHNAFQTPSLHTPGSPPFAYHHSRHAPSSPDMIDTSYERPLTNRTHATAHPRRSIITHAPLLREW